MLLVLWVIATVTFILMNIIPGGPFASEKPLAGGRQAQYRGPLSLK